jgi:hypothetical protein
VLVYVIVKKGPTESGVTRVNVTGSPFASEYSKSKVFVAYKLIKKLVVIPELNCGGEFGSTIMIVKIKS